MTQVEFGAILNGLLVNALVGMAGIMHHSRLALLCALLSSMTAFVIFLAQAGTPLTQDGRRVALWLCWLSWMASCVGAYAAIGG